MQSVAAIPHPSEVMTSNRTVLSDLLAALSEVRADHAVMGGLAAGYHGRVRATVDVDLLVPKRSLKRLQAAMERRGYVVKVFPDMVRVFLPGEEESGESVANLVSREANPVLRAAFDTTEPALLLGLAVRVVRRGAFVALKFHAAVSRDRRLEDRYQDVSDVGRVLTKRFDEEDAELAAGIVAKAYPGAREDLAEFLDDLRHGRPVKL